MSEPFHHHEWFAIAAMVGSVAAAGIAIANAYYYHKISTTVPVVIGTNTITPGEAATLFWLNIILAIIAIIVFIWSIFVLMRGRHHMVPHDGPEHHHILHYPIEHPIKHTDQVCEVRKTQSCHPMMEAPPDVHHTYTKFLTPSTPLYTAYPPGASHEIHATGPDHTVSAYSNVHQRPQGTPNRIVKGV